MSFLVDIILLTNFTMTSDDSCLALSYQGKAKY